MSGEVTVNLRMSASVAEVVINSLDRNPLGLPVMKIAGVIQDLAQQTEAQVKAASEPKTSGPAETSVQGAVKAATAARRKK